MEEIKINVYEFYELSGKAKDTARNAVIETLFANYEILEEEKDYICSDEYIEFYCDLHDYIFLKNGDPIDL